MERIIQEYPGREETRSAHREILEAFARGDNQELRKIIEFARDIEKLEGFVEEKDKIIQLMDELRENLHLAEGIPIKISENSEEEEKTRKNIQDINKLLETEYKGIKGILKFKEKRVLKSTKRYAEGRITELQKDRPILEEEQKERETRIQAATEEMRQIFSSIGLKELGERIIENLPERFLTYKNAYRRYYATFRWI